MNLIRNRRALAAGLAVAALSGSVLTACGGGDSSAAGGESCQGAKVTVGIVNSLSDTILLVADAKGYFEEQGLQVTLTPYDSAAKMIPLLGAGRLDVGAGAPSAGLYNAVAQKINLKIVADKGELVQKYDYMPVLVRKDLVDSGKVKTPADLKGLTVAEPAEGTATASSLNAVLESAGLTYDDVKHTFIGFPDQVAAFANGSIDAATTTEPAASKAVAAGTAVRFADSTETYDNQQLAVALYSSDFAEKRTAVAQCFMNAYVKAAGEYAAAVDGGTWTGEGVDEIVKIVSDKIGLPAEVITKTVPSYVSPDAHVNVESLKKDYAFFQDQGLTTGDVDVDKLIDNSFVDKAKAN
ncbi:MAG TPA: ABC transporter substrate-binding protein [Nocardioides sp.]|nr:ABC transporter substrate-binding protein [Nocardioides sp.]